MSLQKYTNPPIKEAGFDFQIRGGNPFSDKVYQQDLKNKITQVQDEHQKENWDGYGAKPVQSFKQALKFARELFQESRLLIEKVDIIPENDGAICFEWFLSHKQYVAISVKDNTLIYHYQLGEDKGSGETNFAGKQMLFEKIKQIGYGAS